MDYVNELHQRITEVLMPDQPNWLTDFDYHQMVIQPQRETIQQVNENLNEDGN